MNCFREKVITFYEKLPSLFTLYAHQTQNNKCRPFFILEWTISTIMWQSDAKNESKQLNELNDNLVELIEQSAKQIDNLYETNDSPISTKQMANLQFEWQSKRKM